MRVALGANGGIVQRDCGFLGGGRDIFAEHDPRARRALAEPRRESSGAVPAPARPAVALYASAFGARGRDGPATIATPSLIPLLITPTKKPHPFAGGALVSLMVGLVYPDRRDCCPQIPQIPQIYGTASPGVCARFCPVREWRTAHNICAICVICGRKSGGRV